MVKITLAGCKHPILKPWGADYDPWTSEGPKQVTCMVCYERLVIEGDKDTGPGRIFKRGNALSGDNSGLPHADPAPVCKHEHRQPIQKPEKFANADYIDAHCEDCGVVLRHPEGPGRWEEVIFNGYRIAEEP